MGVGSELTRWAARQSWRKIPDALTNYNWTEGQSGCSGRLKEITEADAKKMPHALRETKTQSAGHRGFSEHSDGDRPQTKQGT